MKHLASVVTVLLLAITLVGCSSDGPEADSSASGSHGGTSSTPEQPGPSEFEGTFTGDIVVTSGDFEAFAKGDKSRDVAFLVSCPDAECLTADLRLDVSTGSSYGTTMALNREGDTFTGDARRTNPCPSGKGEGRSVTAWKLTGAGTDRLEGAFDLTFTGCGTTGTAKAEVTADRTAPTAGYLDTEAATAFASAFADYDAAVADLYADYNGCTQREGKAFATCALALYEPWSPALRDFVEPVEEAGEEAGGTCARRLEELDLTTLVKKQQQAVAALEKHESGASPQANEAFIKVALTEHESVVRAVLMCVSPTDTEPVVPKGGFALDLNDSALDT